MNDNTLRTLLIVRGSADLTDSIDIDRALDYYGSRQSRFDLQTKECESKMPPRDRFKSEITLDQLLSERNFSLNEQMGRRLTSKFGQKNLVVREAVVTETAPTQQQRQKLFSKLGIGTLLLFIIIVQSSHASTTLGDKARNDSFFITSQEPTTPMTKERVQQAYFDNAFSGHADLAESQDLSKL